MQYGIAFTPLVPSFVLWIALAAIAVIAVVLLLSRARGAAVRVTALALILLALERWAGLWGVPGWPFCPSAKRTFLIALRA